jgi:hypothetical protein
MSKVNRAFIIVMIGLTVACCGAAVLLGAF